MPATSIYPIKQVYFECTGCKSRWMLVVDPPVKCVEDLKAYTTDPDRMTGCPKGCGSKTVNMAWRVRDPDGKPAEGADPFAVFDKVV